MTINDLKALRKSLGLTQAEMGDAMGLAGRSYQDIENGKTNFRKLHALAAERAAMSIAVERREPMLAPASVRSEALDLTALLRGDDVSGLVADIERMATENKVR